MGFLAEKLEYRGPILQDAQVWGQGTVQVAGCLGVQGEAAEVDWGLALMGLCAVVFISQAMMGQRRFISS